MTSCRCGFDVWAGRLGGPKNSREYHTNKGWMPAYDFKPGNKVYLNTWNLKMQQPSKKLNWKFTEWLIIKQKVSPYAYELELPSGMKIHSVFHVSLLRPLKDDLISRQVPPPQPMIVKNEGLYFVDSIDDMKWNGQKKQFKLLIKWKGYEQQTWKLYMMIKTDAPELVKEFHEDHSTQPVSMKWTWNENKRLPPDTICIHEMNMKQK